MRVLFSPSRREVLTGSLTISSPLAGDQPLLPPTFELTGRSPAQVAAFFVESLCIAPLAWANG